jgi:hypothetical protein
MSRDTVDCLLQSGAALQTPTPIGPRSREPFGDAAIDYLDIQSKYAGCIEQIKTLPHLTTRYWQLHAAMQGISASAADRILKVVRANFIEGTKREIPTTATKRHKTRAIMRRFLSDRRVSGHGTISLAHHNIEGLADIEVDFVHPIWGWIQAVGEIEVSFPPNTVSIRLSIPSP